jgi:GDPmannose 4,6-dehydratase
MVQSKKVALITGVTGQDGSYLADLLIKKGYIVHGIKRRASQFNTQRIDHLYEESSDSNQRFYLHYGDLTDSCSLINVLEKSQPDEVYNLAAQSHVRISFDMPEFTNDVNALGTQRLLEAIRMTGMSKKVRFYQAGSSEMYGNVSSGMLNEDSSFEPCSPYAISKLSAYWTTLLYRESYDMYAANGILFNHESPVRAETFVTRKIARAVARIKLGMQDCLYLGNLDAKRDWGHARDYAMGIWMILQHSKPDDFILATGQQKSVRWFVERAFEVSGISIAWRGKGLTEVGVDEKTNKTLVRLSEKYLRPFEVHSLLGDSSKAKRLLGWEPECTVDQLVEEMVEKELQENG